jgi:hypothetical protein
MVFARNIATGHGFSFNPGVPISGATAPLWTLFLVPFWWLLGPVAGGIIPGVILECLAIIAIFRLTPLLIIENKLAFFAALIASLTWVLVWLGLSGMEVGLYSALSLWGLYFYFKAERLDDRPNYLAYAMFTLAFLSRPECGLFLAAAVVHDAAKWIRSNNKSLFPWLLRGTIIIILLAPYIAFNYSTTGKILPQTFTAKVADMGLFSAVAKKQALRAFKDLTTSPAYTAEDFWVKILILNPIMMLAFIPGIIKIGKVKDAFQSKRIMIIALLLLYAPLMGAISPISNPNYHNMRRVANIIPLIFIFGIGGLFYHDVGEKQKTKLLLAISLFLALVIGMALTLQGEFFVRTLAPYLMQNPTAATSHKWQGIVKFIQTIGMGLTALSAVCLVGLKFCHDDFQKQIGTIRFKNIAMGLAVAYSVALLIYGGDQYANSVKNINECDKATGLYLKGLANPGDIVAVNDIGAVKYFSNAQIFDLAGLISPEITPAMLLDDSLTFDYLNHHKRPKYFAIFPSWFRYIPKQTEVLKPMMMFIPERNTILGGDTCIVYKAVWPDTIL